MKRETGERPVRTRHCMQRYISDRRNPEPLQIAGRWIWLISAEYLLRNRCTGRALIKKLLYEYLLRKRCTGRALIKKLLYEWSTAASQETCQLSGLGKPRVTGLQSNKRHNGVNAEFQHPFYLFCVADT